MIDRIRTQYVALALIGFGVVFRIWAVGHARFTGDESYFWATARNIARFQAAPVFGPPLTGSEAYHPGPIFYYLMAVPQALGSSPWIGGIFVVLLHGLAAWLLYLLVRAARGERAGLIALALLVFAPWDVLYADRVWLSCVAPVWGTITIYAAHRAPGSARWQGAFLFFALVCPQLHMSAPIVWVFCAVLLWFERPERWSRRALAAGVVLAVLAYAAPIVWELRHGFSNTMAIATKGTGELSRIGQLAAPLRVFGYAVLYSTSELGYHFARGYWSPFSEATYYFSGSGIVAWLRFHGLVFAAGNLLTIAVAIAGWTYATWMLVRALRARALGLADRITLGLVLALAAAALLMVVARKLYFPHYTNLLMPIALWPVVQVIDTALERRRLRGAALGVVAAAMFAMAASSIRYYREVDVLNGLSPTMGMVEHALEQVDEGAPMSLSFDGFHNAFAWQMLANVEHGRGLDVRGGAKVRFRVRNSAPHRGPVPANGRLFGPVLLERIGP